MNKNLNALIFGLAIVIAAVVLGNAYLSRTKTKGNISVTGLGQTDFTSDLIVWEARFSRINRDLKQAYTDLDKDKQAISKYLNEKGLADSVVVFNAVITNQNMKQNYTNTGQYIGEEFTGYTLSQTVQVNSKEVDQVERISREVTELLNQGIQLYSISPRYYYTKLDDLKIEMISRATENARVRAERIADNSGAALGELTLARMGIFQITGQNSNEDYSWGGAYNTTSRDKTASITMKLTYRVK